MDISAHKIFATVSPDRTLQSMREGEIFYVYQLERDVHGEAMALESGHGGGEVAGCQGGELQVVMVG